MKPRQISESDFFEANLRLIFLYLMPVGALAALVSMIVARSRGVVDSAFEPVLVVTLLGFTVWLWRVPAALKLIKVMLFSLVCAHQIFGLAAYGLEGKLYTDGLLGTVVWFLLVYPMAFLFFDLRLASYLSLGYMGAGLLIGLVSIGYAPSFDRVAVNSAVQFFLGNFAFSMLLFLYARYRQAYDQMHHIAHTDELTGLANRRFMTQAIEAHLARANRTGRPLSVLLLDLDHFKHINDTFGHSTGDQVLRETAAALEKQLRKSDALARWGGEEFLVLAPDTDSADAQVLAERLREGLEAQPLAGKVRVTVSMGLTCNHPSDTLDSLLQRADTALYRAKDAGRNRLEAEFFRAAPV